MGCCFSQENSPGPDESPADTENAPTNANEVPSPGTEESHSGTENVITNGNEVHSSDTEESLESSD